MSNYDPTRHEALAEDCAWSESGAREAIAAIVAEATMAYTPESGFPVHPREDGQPKSSGLYFGSSGVLWAIWYLHRLGYAHADEGWLIDMLTPLVQHTRREVEKSSPAMAGEVAYLFGPLPVLMMLVELTGDDRWREQLIAEVARSVDAPVRELMWGTPGVLTATHLITDPIVRDEIEPMDARNVDKLMQAWMVDAFGLRVLQEELYGRKTIYNGAVHGMAGQVLPLLQRTGSLPGDVAERVTSDAREWLLRSASHGDHGANWAPQLVAQGTDTTPFQSQMLLQICHGAPGIIVCCRHLERDDVVDEVLLQGAELIWHAGPLAKGPGLCHGTSGNGYALLDAYEQTGEPGWLERARLFGAHASEQYRVERLEHRRQRYSLWTGDPGLAVFLAGCIEGVAVFPTLDVF